MSEVKIVTVDAALAAKTGMHEGTRMVQVMVPTDCPVTVHAQANAKKIQRVQLFDADYRIHFEWEGRGEGRTLGTGSRTFSAPSVLVACMSLWGNGWVVSDMNVTQEDVDGQHRVMIRCEDGGDFPGDWDDLKITLEWKV
jgi:hypothetical protein